MSRSLSINRLSFTVRFLFRFQCTFCTLFCCFSFELCFFFFACCTFICVFFCSLNSRVYRAMPRLIDFERERVEREIERHCTSAHVECSQRNEIFTLRCSYSNASSAVCVEALRRSRRRRRARSAHVGLCVRSLGMLSLARSLLRWPAASCCSFLFRIRKIITKLIINCRAMQFERIMLHSLQYSRSLLPLSLSLSLDHALSLPFWRLRRRLLVNNRLTIMAAFISCL